jgi:subtilisin family serine protease
LAAPSGRTLKQDTIEVLGPRTGTRAFLDGTSMAAPLATRQVAEILAARKKPMTAEQIRRALIDLARAAPAGADVNAVGAGLLVPRT